MTPWPHDEAGRLLDEWARLPDGPAKQMAQDAFFACRKRLAALQEALLRALAAEGGPGDCLRVLFGEAADHHFWKRTELWQKVVDELVRKWEQQVRESRRLRSDLDRERQARLALERRVKELEDARPQLRLVPG